MYRHVKETQHFGLCKNDTTVRTTNDQQNEQSLVALLHKSVCFVQQYNPKLKHGYSPRHGQELQNAENDG